VSNILTRMQSEYAHMAEAKGLELRVVPCSALIRSDLRLLERLVENLLSNAIKYCERGRVLVGCRRRGEKLRIEVWDTGIGIPAEQLEAIFEAYHQLDNPARERSRGLGLGLTVVQRMAELLDHRIDVRSTLGRGSMFAVEVPLGRLRRETVPVVAPEAAVAAGRGISVLLVEDDVAVRESLSLLLALEGYAVAASRTADETLALVSEGSVRPRILVVDRNLPGGMTGVELLGHVRARVSRTLPAIVLTGDTSVETMREITECGAVYLRKPVEPNRLLRLIEQAVGARRRSLEAGPTPVTATTAEPSAQPPGRAVISVVDDDPPVRQAIRLLLEASGYEVEAFATCEAFLTRDRPERSACLLVDVGMPGMDGLELQERLNAEGAEIPVVVITGRQDVPLAVKAMRAGAIDFLQKPFDDEALLSAVERALARTTDRRDRAEAVHALERLTSREREVMQLIVGGHTSKEVAARLGISPRTAENHRARVMEKTDAGSLAELVRLAMAAGIGGESVDHRN
jgi:two-component system CheB/CheR fusion protein